MRRRARVAVALAAAIAVVTGGGAVAYVALRCPSQAELERLRSADEVVAEFAERDVTLAPMTAPAFIRADADYRDAAAYGHVETHGALLVLVCARRCADAPARLPGFTVAGRRFEMRQTSVLGNNVTVVSADDDRRTARALRAHAQPALDELDVAVPFDSRCYVE